MPDSLVNRVMVITGASSGIGRCTARYVAARGGHVVITARREDALHSLADEIRSEGGSALPVPADVTSEEDLRTVTDAAVTRFGTIDTWVNNAGVYLQNRVQDASLADYRRILEVNFLGLVNGTRCALSVMLPRRRGVIIHVSSISARRGVPFASAYSASKAAIDGFNGALRCELRGTGVRTSILYPPTVDTPIYHQGRGRLGFMPKPAPPVADPEEAARMIARLAREGGRYGYFGWARPLALLDAVTPAVGDWLLHHGRGFTVSDTPAGEDNLDAPSTTVPPTCRAGWREMGWRGFTLREAVRELPFETAGAIVLLSALTAGAVRWKKHL